MMNLSKVLAAGAIATSLAFAQPETSDASQPEKSAAKKSSLAEKIGFGIHGDFEYGFLYGLAEDWNGGDDTEAPSGFGFDVGVRGRIPMTSFLQFVPEVNFHYLNLEQEDEGIESEFTQMDLEIPVAIRAVIVDYFYITAGLQATLNLSFESKLNAEDHIDSKNGIYVGMSDLIRWNVEKETFGLGLVFGVGGYIMEYISLDARLVLGVMDAYGENKDEDSWLDFSGAKLMAFKFGVGFWIL